MHRSRQPGAEEQPSFKSPESPESTPVPQECAHLPCECEHHASQSAHGPHAFPLWQVMAPVCYCYQCNPDDPFAPLCDPSDLPEDKNGPLPFESKYDHPPGFFLDSSSTPLTKTFVDMTFFDDDEPVVDREWVDYKIASLRALGAMKIWKGLKREVLIREENLARLNDPPSPYVVWFDSSNLGYHNGVRYWDFDVNNKNAFIRVMSRTAAKAFKSWKNQMPIPKFLDDGEAMDYKVKWQSFKKLRKHKEQKKLAKENSERRRRQKHIAEIARSALTGRPIRDDTGGCYTDSSD